MNSATGLHPAQMYGLRQILRYPGDTVERRVDTVSEIGLGHIRWESRMQFRIPTEQSGPAPESAIVSLGVFPKQRLPDMRVTDQSGAEVPVMARYQQTRILAVAQLTDLVATVHRAQRAKLLHLADTVMSCEESDARKALAELKALAAIVLRTNDYEELSTRITPFVEWTQVLAWARPDQSGRVVLTTTFSTTQKHPSLRRVWSHHQAKRRNPDVDPAPGESENRDSDNLFWASLRLLMMNLGLLAVPLRLVLNGANHSHSFYLMVETPNGVEAETLYWKRLVPRLRSGSGSAEQRSDVPRHYEAQSGRLPMLACHHRTLDARKGIARLNLRIRTERVWKLFVGVVATGCIALFVLNSANDSGSLSSAAGWATATTGGLLAIVNERASDLSHFFGRYLRRLITLLAGLALLLGARIGVDAVQLADSWWNHPVTVFRRMTVFGLAGVVGTVAAFLAVILLGLCLRRDSPIARGLSSDPAHADYRTYSKFRHRRRAVSALVLAAAIAAASFTFLRYGVPEELFRELTPPLPSPALTCEGQVLPDGSTPTAGQLQLSVVCEG